MWENDIDAGINPSDVSVLGYSAALPKLGACSRSSTSATSPSVGNGSK
jgi:hypothetical protein